MTHTQESLSALPARKLDALVSEIVFHKPAYSVVARYECYGSGLTREAAEQKVLMLRAGIEELAVCPDADLPRYSDSWEGFGAIVVRMRELRFGIEPTMHPDRFNSMCFTKNFKHTHVSDFGDLRRATAIAAILAVEGAGV